MVFNERWRILFIAMLSIALVAAIACASDEEEAAAPAPTSAPAATATTAPAPPAETGGIADIDRDDTFIGYLGGAEGRFVDHELWNPYAIGANHQSGPNIIFEPLAFFSAFDDKTIPWLAESWDWCYVLEAGAGVVDPGFSYIGSGFANDLDGPLED